MELLSRIKYLGGGGAGGLAGIVCWWGADNSVMKKAGCYQSKGAHTHALNPCAPQPYHT